MFLGKFCRKSAVLYKHLNRLFHCLFKCNRNKVGAKKSVFFKMAGQKKQAESKLGSSAAVFPQHARGANNFIEMRNPN